MAKNDKWIIQKGTLDIPIDEHEENTSMEFFICFSATDGDIIGSNIIPADPQNDITAWVLECMISPVKGKPRRPAVLVFAGDNLLYSKTEFEKLGIQIVTTSETYPVIDEFIEVLKMQVESPGLPPYTTEIDEEDEEFIAAFFICAADFYKQKPWKLFRHEAPLRMDITFEETQLRLWVVILGVEDEMYGLSIYRSYEDLSELANANDYDEMMEILENTWSMTLTYVKMDELHVMAQSEYEEHGWVIANKSAYPSAIITDPDSEDDFKRPNITEMETLIIVTSALAHVFKTDRPQIKRFLKGFTHNILKTSVTMIRSNAKAVVDIHLPAPEHLDGMDKYLENLFGLDSDKD